MEKGSSSLTDSTLAKINFIAVCFNINLMVVITICNSTECTNLWKTWRKSVPNR